ncbi:universal stress protein [Nocardioides daeguensis]|uniref:Universal stress protein n=1 Tax=Nocardioides daeguensis TaxID=908359 RepID=A0ABP6UUH9_9ACTN|nr:universal stress protein [Nocardioides daeguensis]MBV6728336.1 universal stress protein [Nocardioides daeguensis]MCR1773145.1 universal stress protein [Nocardioides daeguensis]
MSTPIPSGSIVVGADGSKHAQRAITWAAEQAALEGRPLVVLTAEDGAVHRINAEAIQHARATAPDVDVVGLTAADDPRGTLVELSREAHLLVLGSRGRGTVRSMLLGSVSTAVSRLSYCPVVVCRPRAEEHSGKGVLVGVDGTESSLAVLDFAFAQASLRGQSLMVVHCVWDVVAAVAGLRNVRVEDVDLGPEDEAHLLLAESVAGFREKYPDVPVTLRVTHGLVDDVLGGRTAAWDLVVVGRHPLDTVGRLVTGSIATAVVERAHTTVAVVPEPTEVLPS